MGSSMIQWLDARFRVALAGWPRMDVLECCWPMVGQGNCGEKNAEPARCKLTFLLSAHVWVSPGFNYRAYAAHGILEYRRYRIIYI